MDSKTGTATAETLPAAPGGGDRFPLVEAPLPAYLTVEASALRSRRPASPRPAIPEAPLPAYMVAEEAFRQRSLPPPPPRRPFVDPVAETIRQQNERVFGEGWTAPQAWPDATARAAAKPPQAAIEGPSKAVSGGA